MSRNARARASGAARLMDPLRAALGARQSVDVARRRLERHGATVAPVIHTGRPIGLVTRDLLIQASRFGLGDRLLADVVTGACPQVGPRASGPTLHAKARGTAPGLLVRSEGDVIRGIIDRRRLAGQWRPARAGKTHRPGGLLALLSDQHIASVLEARRVARGLRMPVYLVGGAVRDLLLGRSIASLDLTVAGDGIRFAERLARRLDATIVRHRRFGTAVLSLPGGGTLDVATARTETYQKPAALPAVAPGGIHEDLLRRDLTINAMAIRVDGRARGSLCDALGGARDLRLGTLRVVHRLSMIEDPTRAFRAARFSARLGMRWHEETRASVALARSIGAFASLSPQRRFREFDLMTGEPDPTKALARLASLGLLEDLVPRLGVDRRRAGWWRRLKRGEKSIDAVRARGSARALLYLGLLMMGRPGQDGETALAHLGIAGAPALRLLSLPSRVATLERALRRTRRTGARPSRIARICEAADEDALIAGWCCAEAGERAAIETYLRRLRRIRPEVTGSDLRRLGVPPGPVYGHILRRLREARLDGAFAGPKGRGGREAELRMAMRLARGRRLT